MPVKLDRTVYRALKARQVTMATTSLPAKALKASKVKRARPATCRSPAHRLAFPDNPVQKAIPDPKATAGRTGRTDLKDSR